MKLSSLISHSALQEAVNQGYVGVSHHEELGLRTYCYTNKTVIEEHWTPVTRRCRGLVVGPHGEIVAQCMPKFFNAAEHIAGKPYAGALPQDIPYRVYDKVDGSLCHVFRYAGRWRATTKSGFASEQAAWAQEWLDSHNLENLPPQHTYVCEVVYPENRIVVNYHGGQALTLLAVIDPEGMERELGLYGAAWELCGGKVVRQFPHAKLSALLFRAQRNQRQDGTPITGTEAEGYVLRYDNSLRVKVKFSDYVKLHGIVTGLTERHVWELLKEGRSLDELLAHLPDEYFNWATSTAQRLRSEFHDYAADLMRTLKQTGYPADPRHFASYTDQSGYGAALSALYTVLSEQAWKAVRPAATGPWKGDL